ncbi:MAG: hypothetical protein AAFO07_16040, partial [Bacteroidota bacterium]
NVEVVDNGVSNMSCRRFIINNFREGDSRTIDFTEGTDYSALDNCGTVVSMVPSQNSITIDCDNLGRTTVPVTATDDKGNQSTCNIIIDLASNWAPKCEDITVYLDENGTASVPHSEFLDYIRPCPSHPDYDILDQQLRYDVRNNTIGQFFGLGYNFSEGGTVEFTEADEGIVSVWMNIYDLRTPSQFRQNCTARVTVVGNQPPNAICQDITVDTDVNCQATIDPAILDGGSSDSEGSDLIFTIKEGNTYGYGVNNVTLEVSDGEATSECTATITVNDNTAPTAVCNDLTVQLDANGNASITTQDVDGGSTDACGIASIDLDNDTFNCSDVGLQEVTLTVTDLGGNSEDCTADITVEDNVSPVAICNDLTLNLDTDGNVFLTTSQLNNNSMDACGISTLSLSKTVLTCSNVGLNTIALTVTDNNGNVSTCDADITIVDDTAPEPICNDLTVQLEANGQASITEFDIYNTHSEACGIKSVEIDKNAFNCSEVGTQTVTLTATDVNDNEGTCTSNVEVQDNIKPEAVCNNLTVQLDASGNGFITAQDVDGGSTDACGIANLMLDKMDFNCSDIGTQSITLTVTDNNENEDTCPATITVEDKVAPQAICNDLTIQLDANGNGSISTEEVNQNSNDACGIANIMLDKTDFNCSDVGVQSVTLTITDNNENEDTCPATITVEDKVAPEPTCNDLTVQLDADGAASIRETDVLNTIIEVCGVESVEIDENTFSCSEVGTQIVTLTAKDVNNNEGTCTSNVEVQDKIKPEAVCNNLTVQLDANGNGSITIQDVDGGSTDACGIANLILDKTDFDCSDIGTQSITLTVMDNNDNEDTCPATITVEDNFSPVAICNDLTVQLDANGNASITTQDVDGGSTDACGIASIMLDNDGFTCSEVGAEKVTLTVTDNNGKVSTCTSNVMVEDNFTPVAICNDLTVQLDASGNASITAQDVDGGSTDACGIASIKLDNDGFTCSEVGTETVTLTVTDNNGKVSTCTSSVRVEDNVSPIAICNDLTVQLDANGNGSITAQDVDGGSTDACG